MGIRPLPYAGPTPILALNIYERSYHVDYGANAASYVDTFMQVIRWANAERVFRKFQTVEVPGRKPAQ